ncbi:unnamed protein product [Alternaria alternata]
MPLFTLSPCPSYVSTGGSVSELVELLDVTSDSDVEELLDGDGVAEEVSMVPDSLLNASDDVSEGSTKVVLDLIGHVYEGVSDSLAESLVDDKVVQYERLSVVGVGSG